MSPALEDDNCGRTDDFSQLDDCSQEDIEALKCLIESANMSHRAMLLDAIDLYKEAFYLAERVVLYYPESVVLKSSVAYFILGFTKLKGWDDKNFALEKYQTLAKSDLEIDQKLARILKREIDRV